MRRFFRENRFRRVRNPFAPFVKINVRILSVHLHDGALFDIRRVSDIVKPRPRERAEVLPESGNPFAGSGINFLIHAEIVLPVSQRLQSSLVAVYPERHFRVINKIAVLSISVGNGDFVFADPFDMERHISAVFPGFQTEIAVLAVCDFREHFNESAVI